MRTHLLDGTYELFRHHFAIPSRVTSAGVEVAATRGVVESVLWLLGDGGVTHLGVATDHVVESFRNGLWPGYKSSAGVPPELLAQFPLLEEALVALGVVVWPMVDLEADDALAAAARVCAADPAVEQVLIMTPDKDLAQCVVGTRVVQFDRRKRVASDEDAVVAKYGIHPESIPDWLALVGDAADGFPGLPGWGAKTASAVLGRYAHLEEIPTDPARWDFAGVRGRGTLAAALVDNLELVLLFRHLATLVSEADVLDEVDTLRWRGPTDAFGAMCERLEAPQLVEKAEAIAAAR